MQDKTNKELRAEIQELRTRLEEAQETLDAIRRGEVDGLVVSTPKGEQVYTITGAERPYRLLIEEMREGAIMLSDDNTVLYCNRGFAEMVKCPMEKIVGININKLISPTHKAAFKELLTSRSGAAEQGRTAKGITLMADDASIVPTQMSVNSMKMDKTTTTFIVVTDLTEHMEEELKKYTSDLEKAGIALFESEQRWSTTLASIGDAVIATDVAGKISFMNAIAETLTGWTLNEASQKRLHEVFNIIDGKTRQEVEDPVAKVIETGRIVGLGNHTILLRKDGIEIAIDDSGAPIRAKDGKLTGIVLIFRDITERKKAEEALRQAQAKLQDYSRNLEQLVEERTKQLKDAERMATIGQTASMVGHDIRNPLQSIVGELYLAKGELTSMPEGSRKDTMIETLANIENEVNYIGKIVQDLQDFAKPLSPSAEETDLNAIVEDLTSQNAFPENIEPVIEVEKKARKVITDSAYVKRILGNLVSNAVQAMPNGGTLKIRVYRDRDDVILTVEDTGIGIPEAAKARLFTPLFTTKSKGQGFGLSVVKRMSEALGGTVTFESEVGKGTKFIVRLPPPREINGKWAFK